MTLQIEELQLNANQSSSSKIVTGLFPDRTSAERAYGDDELGTRLSQRKEKLMLQLNGDITER